MLQCRALGRLESVEAGIRTYLVQEQALSHTQMMTFISCRFAFMLRYAKMQTRCLK